MRKTLSIFVLFLACAMGAPAQTCADALRDLGSDFFTIDIDNDPTVGTAACQLAKPTGTDPSRAVKTTAGDTNAMGICVLNCGTTGRAKIAVIGNVPCQFDGTTTANDFVQISATLDGRCVDTGSATVRPTRGKIVGRVHTTNASAGFYAVTLFGIGVQGGIQTPPTPTGQYMKDDGTPGTPSGAVNSVFGRTGVVVKQADDYAVADISGLSAALIAKQDALGFTPENFANKGSASGYAPLNSSSRVPMVNLASGTCDATNFVRGDSSCAVPSGGSDPWTYVRLASDFITSSATAVDVTGMSFTPAASTRYEISGIFLLRTATTTVGPRTGVAWPTGMTDGVVTLRVESAAGTQVMQQGNINAAVLAPVGGLPTNTQSYPGELNGMLLAGASPSGVFKVQLASETAGTNVTMNAGSFIRYRTIP